MYLYSTGLGEQGKKSLEKRNIVYTKDGVKVGVKDKTDEQISDRVQRYVVPETGRPFSGDLSITASSYANMPLL